MTALIWLGTAVAVSGLAGLIWCILGAMRARRQGLSDGALRARLQSLVTWNLAALMVSMLGLMLVVVGIFLG